MKQRSFFFRLFAGNMALMAILVAVSFAVAYVYLNAVHRQREQRNQGNLLAAVEHAVTEWWDKTPDEINARCKELGLILPARVTIIAADGRVLGDSDAETASMSNHKTADRPEVIGALTGQHSQDVRFSKTLGIEFRYMACPIWKDGKIVGTVRLAMAVKDIAEAGNFINRALAWSALAAVLTAGALAMLISWLWARPLQQITQTARRIAGGDLNARAIMGNSKEMAQLAMALNEMRANLSTQIDTIADQRENLQTVMTNLREGVVALDDERKIVLANAAAADLLGVEYDDPTGRHIQSVIREPALLDLLDSIKGDDGAQIQLQVRSGAVRRTLHAHAVEVPGIRTDSIRCLLVLRDITDIDRMATVKAEFVANASHELRTPLATIRVALDSLATMDPSDTDQFNRHREILGRHVGRLEAMTRDLLDLHLVEQTQDPLQQEIIDPAELTRWASATFGPRAEQQHVNLSAECTESVPPFNGDRRLLQLIIRNLIENAIKFTEPDGRVGCTMNRRGNHLVITVADTGCGIPPELHNRIFERFFQADSARAGDPAKRGTGLGLSIVKYAAERMGARLDLESSVGVGTTITVTIPITSAENGKAQSPSVAD